MKIKLSPAWISVAVLLVAWQLAADRIQHPALFPSVFELTRELITVTSTASFYQSFFSTIARGLVAFLLATFIAVPASLVALHSSFWKSFFQPYVVILRSIPVIAIVLIALLFLSPVKLPIIIGCITMLPILYQNFLSAWENTDPKLVEMARFYRKTLLQRFRYIYFPQSRALLFSGLSTAIGFGWRAIIIGEVLSSPSIGIGAFMKKSQAYFDMPGLLAWILVAIGGGFVIEGGIRLLANAPFCFHLKTKGADSNTYHPIERSVSISKLSFSHLNSEIFSQYSLTHSNTAILVLKTPSGCGKTTLLELLAGILKPSEGTISFENIHSCGFAFQDLRLIPQLSLEHNIAFAAPHFPVLTDQQQQRLDELIHIMQLDNYRDSYPLTLSGGEQQRIALARALLVRSDLLLLDEPLTGLDAGIKTAIIHFLESDLAIHKPLVVWATHDNPEELLTQRTIIQSFEKNNG